MKSAERFSIRQMIELTGLSEFTIRGWENRYAAFRPLRTETGRREYSKSDIERALLLRELLKRGHKIGQVAGLTNPRLKSLFEVAEQTQQEQHHELRSKPAARAIELMALQKWNELDQFFKRVDTRNIPELIHDFFLPVLQALSASVNAGLVSVSQEHVFSAFLKEKIYSALNELKAVKRTTHFAASSRFVLAAPEGDFHETGLLLAHLLIRSRGYTSLYLGPHTPARDLSETALRFEASHVIIVTTVSKKGGALQEPLTYISAVQKKVSPNVQILVAGSQAPTADNPVPTLTVLSDFIALEKFLKEMAEKND